MTRGSAEPITLEEEGRMTIIPIRDHEAWNHYKKLEAAQWVSQEVDFTKDTRDWHEKLNAGERAYYSFTFGMFSAGDEMVIQNLGENLLREIKRKEIVYFLGVQGYNEQVHSESYSQQIMAIFPDPAEQRRIMNAVTTMPAVGKMMVWARKWMDDSQSLGVRFAGWACFEGGLFQGQFLGLQLLKNRNLMPGVTMLNEFIQRDEGKHCAFACFIIRERIQNRPSEAEFHQVVKEMVEIYDEFSMAAIAASREAMGLDEDAPCPVKHINASMMREYIRFVGDFICMQAGYRKLFGAENPYPEANKQSLNEVGKTNFFEYEPTQYNLTIDKRVRPDPNRRKKLGFCKAVTPRRQTA